MNCYTCDSKEFERTRNLHSENEIIICKNCGSVMHDRDESKENEILEFYRKDYRTLPNFSNLLTTENKRRYIQLFLSEVLEKAAKEKKSMICADIGCATGYLLKFFKDLGHKVVGTEYTRSFRRCSEHFYGIPVREDIQVNDKNKGTFDLMVLYHTLEHMYCPDKKLLKYRELLNENGHLLISTPKFFEQLEDASGNPMKTFENLYHKNHINLFSEQSLKNLFKKVGFKIVKEDQKTYGQTYLLQKCEPIEIKKENYKERLENLYTHKKAIALFKEKKYRAAIDLWSNFPEAWLNLILDSYGKIPEKQNDTFDYLEKELSKVFYNNRIITNYGIFLYRMCRYKEAVIIFKKILEDKPRADIFNYLGFCFEALEEWQEAASCFFKAKELDFTKTADCLNHILHCLCQIPHWQEKGEKQAKEMLYKQNIQNFSIKPNDDLSKLEKEKVSPIATGLTAQEAADALKKAIPENIIKKTDKSKIIGESHIKENILNTKAHKLPRKHTAILVDKPVERVDKLKEIKNEKRTFKEN